MKSGSDLLDGKTLLTLSSDKIGHKSGKMGNRAIGMTVNGGRDVLSKPLAGSPAYFGGEQIFLGDGKRRGSQDQDGLRTKGGHRSSLHRIRVATPRGQEDTKDSDILVKSPSYGVNLLQNSRTEATKPHNKGFGQVTVPTTNFSPHSIPNSVDWKDIEALVEERVSNMALNITRTYSDAIIQLKNAVKHLTSQLSQQGELNETNRVKIIQLQDSAGNTKQVNSEKLLALESSMQTLQNVVVGFDRKLFDTNQQQSVFVNTCLQKLNKQTSSMHAILQRKISKLASKLNKLNKLQTSSSSDLLTQQASLKSLAEELNTLKAAHDQQENNRQTLNTLKLGYKGLAKELKALSQKVMEQKMNANTNSRDFTDILSSSLYKSGGSKGFESGKVKMFEASKFLANSALSSKLRSSPKPIKHTTNLKDRKMPSSSVLEDLLASCLPIQVVSMSQGLSYMMPGDLR